MKVVKRWQELESGLGDGKSEQAIPQHKIALDLIESMNRSLNVSESGKLLHYQNIAKAYGLPSGIVPSYAIDAPSDATSTQGSSEPTAAATTLLKEFDIGISAIAFNKLMVQEGLLETKTRPSSRGEVKEFKVLTDTKFGKNLVSPQNPRETQPHYYRSTFQELINILLEEE